MLDTLLGVVVGAFLTLLAQTIVQLVIVPNVEIRKRREDRWEKNVIELGSLLVRDLPPALNEFRSAFHLRRLANAHGANLSESRQRTIDDRLDSAYAELDALHESQVHWLMRRIESLAPDSSELKNFHRVCWQLHANLTLVVMSRHLVDEMADDVNDQIDKCETNRKSVIEILEDLSDSSSPPRQPLNTRFIRTIVDGIAGRGSDR